MSKSQLRVAALATAILPLLEGKAAAASEGLETTDTAPTFDGNMTGTLITVMIVLAVIICLIVFLIKMLARRNRGWGANRALRTLGGVPLGQHKSLQVVELAGKVYVVGVGEDVTLIDKLEDAEQASHIISSMEQSNAISWNSAALSDLIGKLKRSKHASDSIAADSSSEGPDFERMLRRKLDEQSQRKQQVESLLRTPNQSDRLMDE
jgi:flagellar protein FliO/FliZ